MQGYECLSVRVAERLHGLQQRHDRIIYKQLNLIIFASVSSIALTILQQVPYRPRRKPQPQAEVLHHISICLFRGICLPSFDAFLFRVAVVAGASRQATVPEGELILCWRGYQYARLLPRFSFAFRGHFNVL